MEITATFSSFLTHVRVEKGLSSNTVSAYRRDLVKFDEFARKRKLGLEAELALAGKFIEFYEIATIRGYGIGRQPLLHPHVGQERRKGCCNFHQGSRYPSLAPT